ncbi:MAG: ATP-binding cassette domain-containing protein [Bacteroidales bacterium]|nr:ATP-binding cassette domain-containing protein [Bacteroidales bacterium]
MADSIRLAFGTYDVLSGAWLRAETGKVTGVLGRNGSGKSCMFRAIMGDLRTQDLFVKFNDKVVTGSDEMGLYVKYLPQKPFLPLKLAMRKAFQFFGIDVQRFTSDFPHFAKYEDVELRELSGGEIRMVEIWLCLNSGAPFCILDEPFSYLAPVYVEKVQEMIRQRKVDMGIIISDHNYEALLQVSDDVLLLSDGYVHLVKEMSDLVRYGYCRDLSRIENL